MIEQVIRDQIDSEKNYSVSEIARIAEIHPNTIRKDLKDGRLRGRQGVITRRWTVAGSDLLEWLEKR